MLNFVEGHFEALPPEQICQEITARSFLAGFTLDFDESEGILGDRFRINLFQNQAVRLHSCQTGTMRRPFKRTIRIPVGGVVGAS